MTSPQNSKSRNSKTSTGARFYSPQLDGLRFCAALAVLLHHAPAITLLSHFQAYGWIGVDLFLSLSAYLITRLILIEQDHTGTFDFRSFYIRRMLRIWPLYFTYVTAACIGALALTALPVATVAAAWLSHFSFTNNLLVALTGYSPVPFTAHLWTISLEEQAYIVLPLMIALPAAAGTRVRIAPAVAAAMLGVLMLARAAFVAAQAKHPFIWVLPLHADPIVLGALAAILVGSGKLKPQPLMMVLGVALIATIPLFPPVDVPGAYQVVGFLVTGVACTAIVVGTQTAFGERTPLAWQPMRYLGKISYGIYIYHALAIGAVEQLLAARGLPPAVTAFFALPLTIAMAAASYAVLERPFLRMKDRFARVASRPV